MANATATRTPSPLPSHPKASSAHGATYPSTTLGKPFVVQREPEATPSRCDSATGHAAMMAKRQQWASLNLRQEWDDGTFMRGHLKVAGVKVAVNTEPATVARMKAKLRAVGVQSPEIQEAVGMPLGRFLQVNPRLPLWAALAQVLESTGRFTPEDAGGAA